MKLVCIVKEKGTDMSADIKGDNKLKVLHISFWILGIIVFVVSIFLQVRVQYGDTNQVYNIYFQENPFFKLGVLDTYDNSHEVANK